MTKEELRLLKNPGEEECRRVFQLVYKRADEKMYENKAKMKTGGSQEGQN